MSKGSMAMSAVAVLVTGGYFAYQQFGPKPKDTTKPAWKPGADGGVGKPTPADEPGRDAVGRGSGSGSGSDEVDEHDRVPAHKDVKLEVPSLKGLTPEKATARLIELGYGPNVLEIPPDMGCTYDDEEHDIVPVGAICNQDREPGSHIMSNAKLRVVVERNTYEHGGVDANNEWHRMPDLVGDSLTSARAKLRERGFGDDEFEVGEARSSCGKNIVCDQRPKPHTRKYVNMRGELNIGD